MFAQGALAEDPVAPHEPWPLRVSEAPRTARSFVPLFFCRTEVEGGQFFYTAFLYGWAFFERKWVEVG